MVVDEIGAKYWVSIEILKRTTIRQHHKLSKILEGRMYKTGVQLFFASM